MKNRIGYLIAIGLVILGLVMLQSNMEMPQFEISSVPEAKAKLTSLSQAPSSPLPMHERNLSEWIEQLPTKSDLQALTDAEVHAMPVVVSEAAEELTAYAELVRNSPMLRSEALGFFKSCAEKDAVVDSLRAYCFAKAVTLQLELEGRVWDPSSVPTNIKELATQL